MNNLIQRTITGIVFLVLVIGALIFHKITFFILFELIIICSMLEFYSFAEKENYTPQKIPGIFIGVMLFAANFLYANQTFGLKIFLPIILFIAGIFILELYRKSDQVLADIGFTLLGVIYIALPLSFANYMVFSDGIYHWQILLGFFLLTWLFDTMAYIFGISFGKHRLFERISPKKSWEGFIGGLVFSLIAAYPLSLLFSDLSLWQWAILAIIVPVAGTYGDLIESSFKRNHDKKDSGTMLPGHGGVLDRFDAIFLSLPVFYVFLQIIH
ncbi:MAG: phosphatidate cytidylyltransferase [Bacteroidales bacterium]|nr:phosphatidate cytidylyltransferase [Bacteroidales bacterium]